FFLFNCLLCFTYNSTLNHDVIVHDVTVNNQWFEFLPFLSHRREIYLTFQYGDGDERSTKITRMYELRNICDSSFDSFFIFFHFFLLMVEMAKIKPITMNQSPFLLPKLLKNSR